MRKLRKGVREGDFQSSFGIWSLNSKICKNDKAGWELRSIISGLEAKRKYRLSKFAKTKRFVIFFTLSFSDLEIPFLSWWANYRSALRI